MSAVETSGAVPPAIPYLTQCTGTRDRLLTTWPSPEYHFFARRPFAAGHLQFFHRNSFSSERDQAHTLERLEQQYYDGFVTLAELQRKHDAVLAFERGDVIGEIVPVGPNYFSVLAEAVEDRVSFMLAVLDLQGRLSKAA